MSKKQTITEQIEAIQFETLTEDQFKFLVERALKSIRKSAEGKKSLTKAQKENIALADAAVVYIRTKGEPVTASEIARELDLPSGQKAVAVLKIAVNNGILIHNEGKGSRRSTWELATTDE